MTLSTQPHFVAGHPLSVTVSGALAGETVYLIRGAGLGSGPCPVPLGGLCVDLVTPITVVTSVVADLAGTAEFNLPVPATTVGYDLALQAVVPRGVGGIDSVKSGTAQKTIETPDAGPDLVVTAVTRDSFYYRVYYCNENNVGSADTFVASVTNDATGASFESPSLYPFDMPVGGVCGETGGFTCGLIGDPNCDMVGSVTGTVDSSDDAWETNEGNNAMSVWF
jgi:hypothetical protein